MKIVQAKLGRTVGVALLGGMLIGSAAMAGEVTGLTTFSPNTAARAADVNGNFSAVKSAVDDNNSRINTNSSEIDAVEGVNTTQNSRLSDLESEFLPGGRVSELESQVPVLASGHINGATGDPVANKNNLGNGVTWTSTKQPGFGVGLYRIAIHGVFAPNTSCATRLTDVPNVVVTLHNTGASGNNASFAFINGVGSDCVAGDAWVFIKTVFNGVTADSDFTFFFVR